MLISNELKAPIYDDQEESTHIMQSIIQEYVDPDEAPQTVAPWLSRPDLLVDWLRSAEAESTLQTTIDLHDNRYMDLSDFGFPEIGTNNGEFTGLRVAEKVIIPEILDGRISVRRPIVFTSSKADVLRTAKDEFAQGEIGQRALNDGLQIEFLDKPLDDRTEAARAFRRHVVSVIRSEIERLQLYEDPLTELGIDRATFDAFEAALGLKEFWKLSDQEMAAVLFFHDAGDWSAFAAGTAPMTEHWRGHVELLYNLKARLSGLKPSSVDDRRRYEEAWLRKVQPSLGDLAPLDILMTGSTRKLETLIAFIENVEIDPAYWRHHDGIGPGAGL